MLLQEQVAFQRENGPEISAVAGAVGDFARPEFGGTRVGEERLRSASLSSRLPAVTTCTVHYSTLNYWRSGELVDLSGGPDGVGSRGGFRLEEEDASCHRWWVEGSAEQSARLMGRGIPVSSSSPVTAMPDDGRRHSHAMVVAYVIVAFFGSPEALIKGGGGGGFKEWRLQIRWVSINCAFLKNNLNTMSI